MMDHIAGGFLILSAIFYMIAKSSKEDSTGLMIGNFGLLVMFITVIIACAGLFIYGTGLVVFVVFKNMFM